MADLGKPTLVHMTNSCSQGILWLLEELGVDYDLRRHARDLAGNPGLKETHPQGHAPQLLLADGRVLTQGSAIALYLIRTYDADAPHRFRGGDEAAADPVREEYLTCMGVCDLSGKGAMRLTLQALSVKAPFLLRPVFGAAAAYIVDGRVDPDMRAALAVLESELEGRDWFMGGGAPARPDFMLKFFVDWYFQSGWADPDRYPRLKAWQGRCEARPAWARALAKGDGYDVDFPGHLRRM